MAKALSGEAGAVLQKQEIFAVPISPPSNNSDRNDHGGQKNVSSANVTRIVDGVEVTADGIENIRNTVEIGDIPVATDDGDEIDEILPIADISSALSNNESREPSQNVYRFTIENISFHHNSLAASIIVFWAKDRRFEFGNLLDIDEYERKYIVYSSVPLIKSSFESGPPTYNDYDIRCLLSPLRGKFTPLIMVLATAVSYTHLTLPTTSRV